MEWTMHFIFWTTAIGKVLSILLFSALTYLIFVTARWIKRRK